MNTKKYIMETLSKLKIVLFLMITTLLLSCKNNNNVQSNEMGTSKATVDSISGDTANIKKNPSATDADPTGATGTKSGSNDAGNISSPETKKSPDTKSVTKTGPDSKDGSTYDISSQTKNDTAKLGQKAKSAKKNGDRN